MKPTHALLLSPLLLMPLIAHTFSVQNAPFAFERRYNANSFILNSRLYYERYAPKKQTLGDNAIANLQKKKEQKKQKGRRLFIRHASE